MRPIKRGSLSALLLCLVTASAAVTTPAVAETGANDSYYAVFDTKNRRVGDEVPRSEVPKDATTNRRSEVPTVTPGWEMIERWFDREGDLVYLRKGSWNGKTGWGNEKITRYHNVNVAVARAVTRKAFDRNVDGTTIRYRGYVNLIKCTLWKGCRVEKRVSVQAVNQAKASKGIITAYCDGYFPKCPNWVKEAAAREKK